jgi:uncharacterized membrane protein
MQQLSIRNSRWIGNWLLAVAALHTLVAILFFGKVFQSLLQLGVYDSIGRDPMRAAAIWFLLFGFGVALLGMAVRALEQQQTFPAARGLGIALFLLSLCGVILMPASGFWLAFPAALGLLRRRA